MHSIHGRFFQKNFWLYFFLLFCGLAMISPIMAQPITGVWRGKITRGSGFRQSTSTVELKFIRQGDSLVGTSYYYGLGKSYIRYAIKGWFDPEYNTVHWKDYHLIEMVPVRSKDAKKYDETLEAEADFSCPDGRTMHLDGSCKVGSEPEMKLELRKMERPLFPDEWDSIIDGFFVGMAQKELIDSVWLIASEPYIPKKTEDIVRGSDIAKTIPREPPPPVVAGKPVNVKPVLLLPPDIAVTQTETKVIPPTQPEPALVKTEAPPKEQQVPKAVFPTAKTIDTTALVVNKPPEKPVIPKEEIKEKPKEVAPAPPVAVAKPPAPKPNNAPPEDYTALIARSNERREREKAQNTPPPSPAPVPVVKNNPPLVTQPPVEVVPPKPELKPALPKPEIAKPVMGDAFIARKKVVQKEIPVLGDSIELRFYDNAEVDGDSISLFLNGKALFQHVKLDVRPYKFKISVLDLPLESELTMVAENLGSIPPNTAFMEAFVKGTRYTARLESTENSSGVIRLIKKE